MPSVLLAVLTALPDLLSLLQKIGPELESLLAWIKHEAGDDLPGYLNQVGQAFSLLREAQTAEQKQNAAQAIADMIRKSS